ncbi:MAG: hypothetical protein KGL39_32655 [Patescibacteria group bacterium]|nr:hypothetical protein [Patescibacteria group bacterium]
MQTVVQDRATISVIGPPEESVTPDELRVLQMVRRHLISARKTKMTGTLTFEVQEQDGGITGKWATVRVKER